MAGLPAIVWFVYLAVSPRVQGCVPTPPRPITATLVTVGVLAIGLVWTVVRRTRGPHDLLTGTWVSATVEPLKTAKIAKIAKKT